MPLHYYHEDDPVAFANQVKRLFPQNQFTVNQLEDMFVMYVVGRYGDVPPTPFLLTKQHPDLEESS